MSRSKFWTTKPINFWKKLFGQDFAEGEGAFLVSNINKAALGCVETQVQSSNFSLDSET